MKKLECKKISILENIDKNCNENKNLKNNNFDICEYSEKFLNIMEKNESKKYSI